MTFHHFIGLFIPRRLKYTLNDIIEKPELIQYYFFVKKRSKKLSLNKKISHRKNLKITSKIAIQFHIFYLDLLPEIYSYLKNIKIPYDLYITTDDNSKKNSITSFFDENKLKNQKVEIQVVENRGRDIWPFIKQISPIYSNYDYIAHFHTKKSLHTSLGDEWRKYLFNKIIGKNNFQRNVIAMQEDSKIGFISTQPYMKIINSYYYNLHNDDFKTIAKTLLNKLNINNFSSEEYENCWFPAGNMFIARTSAIHQLFDYPFTEKDFPDELGQINGTLQHIIEFVWAFIISYNGYLYKEC